MTDREHRLLLGQPIHDGEGTENGTLWGIIDGWFTIATGEGNEPLTVDPRPC